MQILLANPRGFCAGVNRAIDIVERALELFGAPIYVRHEVVHNQYVVSCLREKGAVFVEELHEVPDQGTVIFSAHGVSKAVQKEAEQRRLKVFDATCPLVTKVHLEVARHQRGERECILIGHAGHPEVEGTMGQYENSNGRMILVETLEDVAQLRLQDPDNVTYVTQTTLSMDDTAEIIDALKARFPKIEGPKKDDICYATQNRQDAVKNFASQCDLVLVVGSQNSSNSNRLCELARRMGTEAYLIDNAAQIDAAWLQDKQAVGVTAGASAPEVLVKEVVERLKQLGGEEAREANGVRENVSFSLPRSLA
ncbi:MAG: 4-hydroxy-3-methylbut-2-enyl diphosphate reductase [Gammaproteobacteria bacterium]|nr:4-hydroxy-3-methylbut-2-enyl diphosphate reductase [Gammaproteobacteria bacterium]MDH5803082.1 4-hydroxy-3-methylbut-2-enyl diphosphate reductase [Gammaproteobacteria bacterium]